MGIPGYPHSLETLKNYPHHKINSIFRRLINIPPWVVNDCFPHIIAVWWFNPSEKYEFVSWDDCIPK